jgi:hypothetical protein
MAYEILPPDDTAPGKPAGRYEILPPAGASIEKDAAAIRAKHIDEMPWYDKAAVNVGAGIDNVVQGAKQLLPGAKGMDDATLRDKRMRDRELADGTTGGSALQVAGEVLPTLAIPGGALARGVGMAGRGLASLAAESGIVGAAGGALQPTTSDESRTFNSALGGTLGAALPGLLAAAKGGVGMLTQWGARDRASAQILKELGGPDQAKRVLDQIAAHQEPAATAGIPLTPAEIAQNPALGMLERASATRDPAGWAANVRLPQAQARDEALQRVTRGADELDRLMAERAARADANYTAARSDVPRRTPDVLAEVADLEQRPAFQKAVREAVQSLRNQGDDIVRDGASKARAPVSRAIDEANDDIVTAIRKLGGIDPADEAVGSLAKANNFGPDPRFGPVWRSAQGNGATGTTAGHSLDRMAELLHQHGYISDRSALDEVMDKIADTHMGLGQHFSVGFDHGAAQAAEDPLASAIMRLTAKLDEKGAKPERGVDFIGNGVKLAHETKLKLDDMITSAQRSGNNNEARTLIGMRDKLVGLLERDDFSSSYGNARKTYAADSKAVDAAQGAADIRGTIGKAPQVTYADASGAMQSVPALTSTRLDRAVGKHGENRFGDVLDAATRDGLAALKSNLDRTEGLQRLLKNTGTSGGGSNTAMDTSALARTAQDKLASKLPLIGEFFKHADAMTKAALSDFLQNPQRFTAALSKKLEQRRPLTRSEEAILSLARSASAASPELLLSQ